MGKRRNGQPIHGWLLLDKPVGLSSNHALSRAQRILDAKKGGHAGTLDPFASGLLPLAFGEATKTIPFAMDGRKTYDVVLQWGTSTDSFDSEGDITGTSDVTPSDGDIDQALPTFIGSVEQVPPAFSAIKVDGKRAYDLARAGEVVTLKSRIVECFSIERMQASTNRQSTFRVTCGKGYYIRAFARDLGLVLGADCHVIGLRRRHVGPFSIDQAFSLEKLTTLGHNSCFKAALLPLESVLDDISAITLSAEDAQNLRQGRTVDQSQASCDGSNEFLDQAEIALARTDQGPIALVSILNGSIRPRRVFQL